MREGVSREIRTTWFRRWLRGVACLWMALSVLGWMGVAGHAAGEEEMLSSVQVSWLPEEPRQGEVLHLRLRAPAGVVLKEGEMLSRPIHFSSSPGRSGEWDALFGIDLAQIPGPHPVRIWLEAADGPALHKLTSTIRILPQAFGEEHLTLPDSKVTLSPESLARVNRERVRIASLWEAETPERFWEGPFLVPVQGRPGSPFGLRRWINEQPRSPHTGMDIRAPEGTPVLAANHGRVALVGDFFFGGNSVFLDHGQGVYTMYFHLSSINVVEGQNVTKGDLLGLVGMTGRATGHHLHWGVRLGGARVDPVSLVARTEGVL